MNLLILLAIAVGPAIAIMSFVYSKDKNDREPLGVLLVSFFWGCFSVVPAIILESVLPGVIPILTDGATHTGNESLISVFISTFFVIGLSEEVSKFIFLRYYSYKKRSFNEPFDGIMYAIMVGMGFATIENLLYVFGEEGGMQLAVMRALTAVPAHATFAVILGYYVGLAKFNPGKEKKYFLQGIIYATILHGCYDFFLFQNLTEGLYIGAIVSLIFGVRFSMKAIKTHQEFVKTNSKMIAQDSEKIMNNEIITSIEESADEDGFDSPYKPK